MSSTETKLKERLRLSLDLFVTGEAMMRQNLRRKFPNSTPTEIETRLAHWLHARPGAENGDFPGKLVSWPLPLP